jgi:hypothetical protein|tara:strand:- start:109 stop:423 length:315 start_codon:yes stop_codon:yes gene_type:complete
MSLEKVITEDKIEIVGEFKTVQIRTCTQILEDGVELSSGFHRHVVTAGQDYSGESAEVQAICAAVHTEAVVTAYLASQVVDEPVDEVVEEEPVEEVVEETEESE